MSAFSKMEVVKARAIINIKDNNLIKVVFGLIRQPEFVFLI